MDYFLKKYENDPKMFTFLINITLVKYLGRPACLIDLQGYNKDLSKEEESDLNKVIKEYNLFLTDGKFKTLHYFVTREKIEEFPETDEDIGELLGFFKKDPEYGNSYKDRVALEIFEEKTNNQIIAQLYILETINLKELENYAKEKVIIFNNIFKMLKFPYSFKFTIKNLISYPTLRDKIDDQKFVEENIDEYINVLVNETSENSIFVLDPDLIFDHYDLFKYIFELAHKEFFIENDISEEGYLEFEKELLKTNDFDEVFKDFFQ